jgi:hypothetical protein
MSLLVTGGLVGRCRLGDLSLGSATGRAPAIFAITESVFVNRQGRDHVRFMALIAISIPAVG